MADVNTRERDNAQRCLMLAEQANFAAHRAMLLEMAKSFQASADKVETAEITKEVAKKSTKLIDRLDSILSFTSRK